MTTLQQKIKYQIRQYQKGLQTELGLYQELYNLAILYDRKTINKLSIQTIHNKILQLIPTQEYIIPEEEDDSYLLQEYYQPYDLYDVLDQEDIDNFINNQIYTGINLITINPITKPNLGIQFQDKWYNTITELENILEPDTTYNLEYITDYDSDTQQTENYYIIKEVK